MAIKIKPKFLTNISKSLGRATANAITDLTPTISGNIRDNVDFVKEVYNTPKEKIDMSKIKNSFVYKSSEELVRNAIKDLKSGELYNQRRLNNLNSNIFGGSGEDGFNFDSMFDEDGSFDSNNITNNINNTTVAMDTGLNQTFDNGVSRITNLSKASLEMNQVNASVISKHLSDITDFQRENTTKFYNDVSEKITSMAGNISQLNGFASVLAEVSVGGIEKSNKQTPLQQLLGIEGFNIKEMLGFFINNKTGGMSGSNGYKDMFDMMIKPMIEEVIANPIGTILKKGVTALLPKAFKETLTSLDSIVKSAPLLITGYLGNNKLDNKLTRLINDKIFRGKADIGSIIQGFFKTDLSSKRSVDNLGNYKKGKVAFDGIARRSIVNVIPALLSKILSQVSTNKFHQGELVYDYDKGRFTNKTNALKGLDRETKNFTIDNFETKEFSKKVVGSRADGKSEEELEDFSNNVNSVIMKIIKNGTFISKSTKWSDISKNKEVGEAVLNTFRNQTNLEQVELQKHLMEQTNSYQDVWNNFINNESMVNNFDEDHRINGYKNKANRRTRAEEAKRKWQEMKDKDGFMGSASNIIDGTNEGLFANSKLNPFYWATIALNSVTDKTIGGIFGSPDTSTINTESTANNINNSSVNKNKTTVDTGSAKRSTTTIETDSNGNSTINIETDGTNTVNKTKKEPQSTISKPYINGESIAESKATSNNFICDELSILPDINKNIEHIIMLLEAKASGDGLKLKSRDSKFGGIVSKYYNKTKSFIDSVFDSSNTGGTGNKKSIFKKAKGFLTGIFNRDAKEKTHKDKKNKNENGRSITETIKSIFTNSRDSLSSNLDNIKEFTSGKFKSMKDFTSLKNGDKSSHTGGFISSILGFGSAVFSSLGSTIGKSKDFFKGFLDKKSSEKRNGKSTTFGDRIKVMLANFGLGSLNLAEKGSNAIHKLFGKGSNKAEDLEKSDKFKNTKEKGKGIFNKLSSWFSIGKLGGSSAKTKFNTPTLLNKVYNPATNALRVEVVGGSLDSIKKPVKVTKYTGDRNKASEQFEDFKMAQNAKRESHSKNLADSRARKEAERLAKLNKVQQAAEKKGEGMFSNMISGIMTNVLGEVLGNKWANRGLKGAMGGGNGCCCSGGLPGGDDESTNPLEDLLGGSGEEGSDGGAGTEGNSRQQRRERRQQRKEQRRARRQQRKENRRTRRQARRENRVSRRGTPPGPRRGRVGRALGGIKKVGKGAKKGLGALFGGAKKVLGSRGAKKGLGVLGKVGKGAARLAGKLALPLTAATSLWDGVSGWRNAQENLGLSPEDEVSWQSKAASSLGSIGSGLTLGMMDKEWASKGLNSFFGQEDKENNNPEISSYKGSYRDGGVIDYTGNATVHGTKDNPEMVLNSQQSGALFSHINKLSMSKKKDDMEDQRDASLGDRAKNPLNVIANWVGKIGEFFSFKGAGGALLGGLAGIFTGATLGGLAGKVAKGFKGIFGGLLSGIQKLAGGFGSWFSKLFGIKEDTASASGSGGGVGDAKYAGSGTAEKTWNMLKDYGFSDEGAAGVLGNLMQESSTNIDPTLYEKKDYKGWRKDYGSNVNAGGVGIMQWTGSRRYELEKASGYDKDKLLSIDFQLNFMRKEMEQNKAKLEALKNTKDTDEAVRIWEAVMERAGNPQLETRKKYAKQALNKYKGTSADDDENKSSSKKKKSSSKSGSKTEGESTGGKTKSADEANEKAKKVIAEAKKWLNKLTYSQKPNERNPQTGHADCSSFVNYCFKTAAGINLQMNTEGQYTKDGKKKKIEDASPGDIILFKNTTKGTSYDHGYKDGVSHVGIVIGGGEMIHMANSPGPRKVSYMSDYWKKFWLCAKDVLNGTTGSGSSDSSSSGGGKTNDSWLASLFGESKAKMMNVLNQNHKDFFDDVWGTRSTVATTSNKNDKNTATKGDSYSEALTALKTNGSKDMSSKTFNSMSPLAQYTTALNKLVTDNAVRATNKTVSTAKTFATASKTFVDSVNKASNSSVVNNSSIINKDTTGKTTEELNLDAMINVSKGIIDGNTQREEQVAKILVQLEALNKKSADATTNITNPFEVGYASGNTQSSRYKSDEFNNILKGY